MPSPGTTPAVQFASDSIQFGMCAEGQQVSKSVDLAITGTSAVAVTIVLVGAQPGTFVAQLCNNRLEHSLQGENTMVVSVLASSPGNTNNTASIPPPPASGDSLTTYGSYSLTVNFTAPATPMPGNWTGTVLVSWEGGSTQIALDATTADLSATIVSKQPIELTPGGNATVSVKLDFNSLDTSAVEVKVAAAAHPPKPDLSGLNITAKTVKMSPTYVSETVSGNPKSGNPALANSGATGIPHKEQVLVQHRTATVEIPISAGVSTQPGNKQAFYLAVTCASLPAPVGGERDYEVLFDVPPLPVKISPPDKTVNLLAGSTASVQLSVAAAGANTLLDMGAASATYESAIPGGGAMSGKADVKVTWPSYENNGGKIQIPIGGGKIETSFSISAPASAQGGVVSIALPWSAYDGKSKGTTVVQINLLPTSIQLTGKLGYAKLSGSYVWSLNADGYSYFTGSVTVPYTEVLAQDYACGIVLSATNAGGAHAGVTHSGTMGGAIGTFFGDDSDSWSDVSRWNGAGGWINSNDAATILDAWAQLCEASRTVSVNYSPDALDTVIGILTGATALECVFFGLYEAGKCVWTAAGSADSGGDDGGDGDDDDDGDDGYASGSLACS